MRLKNQGLVKIAENRRAILDRRNEVETIDLIYTPLYTNLLFKATLTRLRFFFILCCLFSGRNFYNAYQFPFSVAAFVSGDLMDLDMTHYNILYKVKHPI